MNDAYFAEASPFLEMADLLVRALARDMRGVHDQVLRSVQRDQITLDHPEEITDIVSTAFARS